MIEVELSRILISDTQDSQVIVLKEKGGGRILPIWIGLFEAVAINRRVRGETPQRPMTHDLLCELIRTLTEGLEKVTIDQFMPSAQGGVFHAKLHVRQNGKGQVVDCRPSDAIALAVRLEAPLFVADEIMEKESQNLEAPTPGPGTMEPPPEDPEPDAPRS
mgnify:CR=1 FL=1